MNFSEVIAQTDVEMQRLGWTIDQGREHLIKNYGKRSRTLLTQLELLDFLQYLESQPLNRVVSAKINVDIEQLCWMEQQGQINSEIERLCWMKEEEQEYVTTTSSKQSQNSPTQEKLLELLKYFEAQPIVEYPSNLDAEYEEFQNFSTYSEESDNVITRISSEDLSQILAKTDVQMQRLGWTTERGREHLIKTYGKRSRTLLTEAELLDFRQYLASLASQPTPADLSDVIAKTDVEIQRLGWTPEQGREHLIETYGKRGRTLLTEEELHGFLKYLQSQPDPIAGF
ncbi:MAG: hypothetical protein RMY64_05040 [Nostoc sp. DedQUE08]|uniref:hypothetical protein n=1 Tax=Nostoc sp. DedQUE08 TaxID=3075393 RepID=UPI002AD2F4EF|nr:hypothetical protein [Nostoc sp. DedQUE08]MDZ8064993.1 hypothetical protein [Nostoc sp. DedQUE08]